MLRIVPLLLLVACHTAPPHVVSCTARSDCSAGEVCLEGACAPMCASDASCGSGRVCTEGFCVPSMCGESAECGPELTCQAGACASPPGEAATCVLTPEAQVVHDGAPGERLRVVARDAAGVTLPEPPVTFSASGAVTVDATGTPAGAGAGSGTITAHTGAATCTAQLTSFAAATQLRVVVIDETTRMPVANAVVMAGSETATTDASGIALFPAAQGPRDVHVFDALYDLTSFIGVSATDLLVPLHPNAWIMRRGFLTAQVGAGDFAAGSGAVQAAVFGASQPGGPGRLSLDALFGRAASDTLSIGGFSKDLLISQSLAIGTASGFFNGGKLRVAADPGVRVAWGFGGNFDAGAMADALSRVLADSATTADAVDGLTKLVALFEKTNAGFQVGVHVAATGGWPGQVLADTPFAPRLAHPRALRVTVSVPQLTLPMVAVAAGAELAGFTPLGLAAGTTATVPLALAPESDGLEGSPVTIAAAAFDPLSLTQAGYAGPGTQMGPPHLGASVLFQTVSAVHPGDAIAVQGPFLPVPDASAFTFSRSARSLVVGAPAVTRFEIEAKWGSVWRVSLPAGARSVTLPVPPRYDGNNAAIFDPLQDGMNIFGDTGAPVARAYALRTAATLDALATFGATAPITGWAVTAVPVAP